MALTHLKADEFCANAARFQAAILAYNTVRWMSLLSGNVELQRWEPQTIRTFLIRIAGKLVTGENQFRIKVNETHLFGREWEGWLAFV